ncbi:MAG: magnesium chelatase, partial [Sphingomonas sp.]|nr:magnesium chelatase [Sphingomonas sp.]
MRAEAPIPVVPVRVVVITLDNHLSGAFERAQQQFDAVASGVSIGFHAAADWEAKPDALAATIADIGRADIILCTMLFLEDHIRAVLPALEARREACDALVGLMSAGEIVRLTRMGDYRMDRPARGPLALLKKLRGSGKPGTNSGAGQMK